MEATGKGRRSLVAAGLVVIAALAVGTLVPRAADPDYLFGLDRYRELGVPIFVVAAAVVLALLLVPGIADGSGRLLARLRICHPTLAAAVVVLLAGALFWLLPNHFLSGDASAILLFAALGDVHPSNALTCYLINAGVGLLGLDPLSAIRLLSTLSGMVYAAAAVAIGRECFEPGARRVGLTALLLTVGTVALFFGTIEVYAPVTATLALYLLFGIRWLKGHGRGIAPPLTLGIAFVLHGSAGLLLPSLLILANGGRLFPWSLRRWAIWGAVFLVPVLAVLAALWFGTWAGEPPEPGPRLTGTFLGVGEQPPLLTLLIAPDDPLRRYAIFDLEHVIGVANLILLVGLPSLALLLAGRRRWDPVSRFVGVAALFLVLFPLFWNVSYDLSRDWDLFSSMGVPIALLAGLSFFGARGSAGDAVRATALSVFCLFPLVVTNHSASRHRQHYAEEAARTLDFAIPVAVAWTAVEAMLDGPGATESRPPDRSPRVWREELERLAVSALQRSGVFPLRGLEDDSVDLASHVDAALAPIVEELVRTARRIRSEGRPPPPPELLTLEVVSRRPLDLTLLSAVDAALENAGVFDPADPAVEVDVLRRALRRNETVSERWCDLLADSLLAVIEAPTTGQRWRSILTAQRKWAARNRALLPPGYSSALRRAELLLSGAGDLDLAERHGRHWLSLLPADPRWLVNLGGVLIQRGEGEEGILHLRRAIDADPHHLIARIHLANELIKAGKLDEAETILVRGLRLSGFYPSVSGALCLLAWLRLERGEADLAASAATLALERFDPRARSPGVVSLRRRAEALLERVEAMSR